jgi:uncharacterized peroxidase-related enzyme
MTFLGEPAATPPAQAMYDDDLESDGYVMNGSRLWAHQPQAHEALFALIEDVAGAGGLSMRERGILVTACASTLGDSYCSLAWGAKLAAETDPNLAAGVLTGADTGLSPREQAMASWARRVVADPNGTAAANVESLRVAGLDDPTIFAVTVFVALRLAFSTVNDALGAAPDAELWARTPSAVTEVVTWGR